VIPLGDEGRRRRGRLPLVTTALVLAELAAFLVTLRLAPGELAEVVARWALVPARLAPLLAGDIASVAEVERLFGSIFLHAGWLHLLGNLLFLWVFGRAVEAAMGSGRYLGFFLLCGAVAGVVHTLMAPGSTVPTVGASGAISGLLGAYLGLHPRARVRSLVLLVVVPVVIELPAALWLLAWLALQLLEGARALAAPPVVAAVGVAWWAHVGGFGAGLLLHRFFLAGRDRPSRAR
jgi:membrane associated rhomboid family serine protease